MKQLSIVNKKWILTTSLLAVLVTQHSYQTSSRQFSSLTSLNGGEIVMSSNKTNDKSKDLTKDDESKKLAGDLAKDDSNKTESGAAAEGSCLTGDCSKKAMSTLTISSYEEFQNFLTAFDAYRKLHPLTSDTTPETKSVVKTQDAAPEEDVIAETPAEKRERIKQEKLDKLEAKKQANIDKFQEKMDSIKDKCDQDIECLSTEFTSALSRYDGNKSVPDVEVKKAFKSVVGDALSKSLYTTDENDLTKSMSAIQSLMQDMPEKYKNLKQSVMISVQSKAAAAANKVATEYSNLNDLAKQNKPQEYLQALSTAKQDNAALTYLSNSYSSAIVQSLDEVSDTTILGYYQRSYLPNMNKIMMAAAGAQQTTTTVTTPTTGTQTTTTRDGRSGTVQPSTTQTTSPSASSDTWIDPGIVPTRNNVDTKMTRENTWLLPTDNSGIQVGSPSNTSRGGRGGNIRQ